MEAILRLVDSIHTVSDEVKFHLGNALKEKRVSKYEMILKAGQVSKYIYFIEKGLLRAFYFKKEIEVSAWFMKEDDVVVSVSSFFTQSPSKESIHALEDSILYYLSYDDLQEMYKDFPEFNFVGRVITEKYYGLSEDRIAALRMLRSQERYDYVYEHFPELVQRVPLRYLASYLGVTEVTLKRIRSKK